MQEGRLHFWLGTGEAAPLADDADHSSIMTCGARNEPGLGRLLPVVILPEATADLAVSLRATRRRCGKSGGGPGLR
jgi:hypothetical protein